MMRIVGALRRGTMLSEPNLGSSAADTASEKSMIVEMRTYTLQPGTVGQFEERFGAALAVRAKLSPLAAFWHNEVGPLKRVIHVWPYKDFEERTRGRAESPKQQSLPPHTREIVVNQQSESFLQAPISPKL